MEPEPESDADLSRLVGASPSFEAALLGGAALAVVWPIAKLAQVIRRRRGARS